MLPALQTERIKPVIHSELCCYLSRSIKRFENDDMNKVGFTRATWLLFSPEKPFVLYNARGSVMKWSGTGEYKAFCHLSEVVRMNSNAKQIDNAILFAESGQTAMATLLETSKPGRLDMPFSSIYRAVHYVPLSENGIRLLRLLIQPGFEEKLIAALIPASIRTAGRHISIDCDGEAKGHYILSHLDGDIARLLSFLRSAAGMPPHLTFEIVCYPWQIEYVSELVDERFKLTSIAMKAIENALFSDPGSERGDVF